MHCNKIAWILIFFTTYISASLNLHLGEDNFPPLDGRICAYGDFDKDRYTDLLVQRGNKLVILVQSEQGAFTETKQIGTINLNADDSAKEINVFCALGDFDGDTVLDVMVTKGTSKDEYLYETTIYFYNTSTSSFIEYSLEGMFMDQLTIMDINGDGYSDIVGFKKNETGTNLFCLSGGANRKLTNCKQNFIDFDDTMEPYHLFGIIFADMDDDLDPEIVFAFKKDGKIKISVWKLSNDRYEWTEIKETSQLNFSIPEPFKVSYLGGPVVSDFNADASMDIFIPVCTDDTCERVTQFLIWSKKQWNTYQLDLKDGKIVPDKYSKTLFRVGDFSLDGYPDLIATIKYNNNKERPMILENRESDTPIFQRRFELLTNMEIVGTTEMTKNKCQLSAFFDLKEDGNLDILVEYFVEGTKKTKIDFIKCDDKGDTTFLKVQIFSNICAERCPDTKFTKRTADIGNWYLIVFFTFLGSGITWHGACVSFTMTDSWVAGSRVGIQCQLPQTSHRTLYSPFVLFGLGRSPNFVDDVNLGSPRWIGRLDNQRGKLSQIVPNSRIIVVPPEPTGVHWLSRLYLTPSKLIIQSLLVLVSVCIILLLLVFFLHFRERRQDRKERQSQTHRFHFDAM